MTCPAWGRVTYAAVVDAMDRVIAALLTTGVVALGVGVGLAVNVGVGLAVAGIVMLGLGILFVGRQTATLVDEHGRPLEQPAAPDEVFEPPAPINPRLVRPGP